MQTIIFPDFQIWIISPDFQIWVSVPLSYFVLRLLKHDYSFSLFEF